MTLTLELDPDNVMVNQQAILHVWVRYFVLAFHF